MSARPNKLFLGHLTLSLGLLGAAVTAQMPQRLDPNNTDVMAGNQGTVKVFHVGPYTVPAARQVGSLLIPGEWENTVTGPNHGDIWMTSFDPRLVDENKVPVEAHVQEGGSPYYLHHCVLYRTSSSEPSSTCGSFGSERVISSGGERAAMALPNGYGYRIRPTDTWRVNIHMQNFTNQAKKLYLQYSMSYQPASVQLTPIRQWWLDSETNCRTTYYVSPGSGLHVVSRDHTARRDIHLVSLQPHMHCGGVKMELINKTTGQLIATMNNTTCPVLMNSIILQPPVVLPVGTTVTVRSTYERHPTKTWEAMGILHAFGEIK